MIKPNIPEGYKYCHKCSSAYPLPGFHNNRSTKDGKAVWCKGCVSTYDKLKGYAGHKHNSLMARFGISYDKFLEMLEAQGGRCAICGQAETAIRMGRLQALSVDHCHKTGKIRGLLCNSCNRGLGKLRDSIEILESATLYLNRGGYIYESDGNS